MECTDAGDGSGYSLTAKRNSSLSSSGRHLVFGLILGVSLSISTGFALLGAWPIMPFAGLEMLVLYLAFRYLDRHAGDYERITISGDRLLVECLESGRTSRFEFNCCWAQVILKRDVAGSRCRLALRSHGKEVEIGQYLTDEQRISVARQLKSQLGRVHR